MQLNIIEYKKYNSFGDQIRDRLNDEILFVIINRLNSALFHQIVWKTHREDRCYLNLIDCLFFQSFCWQCIRNCILSPNKVFVIFTRNSKFVSNVRKTNTLVSMVLSGDHNEPDIYSKYSVHSLP